MLQRKMSLGAVLKVGVGREACEIREGPAPGTLRIPRRANVFSGFLLRSNR
jgi:hypothetical protein